MKIYAMRWSSQKYTQDKYNVLTHTDWGWGYDSKEVLTRCAISIWHCTIVNKAHAAKVNVSPMQPLCMSKRSSTHGVMRTFQSILYSATVELRNKIISKMNEKFQIFTLIIDNISPEQHVLTLMKSKPVRLFKPVSFSWNTNYVNDYRWDKLLHFERFWSGASRTFTIKIKHN